MALLSTQAFVTSTVEQNFLDYDYVLNMDKTYRLVNRPQKNENKLTNAFKNSIFGSEIGVRNEGFSYIAILSVIVAIGTFCIMYLFCRI